MQSVRYWKINNSTLNHFSKLISVHTDDKMMQHKPLIPIWPAVWINNNSLTRRKQKHTYTYVAPHDARLYDWLIISKIKSIPQFVDKRIHSTLNAHPLVTAIHLTIFFALGHKISKTILRHNHDWQLLNQILN